MRTRTTRSTATAVLVGAGLLVAGCTGGGEQSPPPPTSENGLASFDPCAGVPQEVLQSIGATEPGEPVDQGIGEQGCEFSGSELVLAVYKGQSATLEYWEGQRGNFAVFEPNQVGSRKGIKQITKASSGSGSLCTQVVEAGGGSISVQVNLDADKVEGNDPCAKALEIAQRIEPKLPK
ncbi:DUF3558 domain-containing protein [Saccharopolyspora taberi]